MENFPEVLPASTLCRAPYTVISTMMSLDSPTPKRASHSVQMEVKLVYNQGSIQFDPLFHEIYANHGKKMSNFLRFLQH